MTYQDARESSSSMGLKVIFDEDHFPKCDDYLTFINKQLNDSYMNMVPRPKGTKNIHRFK